MEKFISFAKEYGLIIEEVVADGNIHRVPVEDAKRDSARDGAYCLYDNDGGIAGWIQNHRSGEYQVYSEKAEGYKIFTTTNSNKIRIQSNIAKAQEKAAASANFLIESICKHPYSHPYLHKKGVFAFGIYVDNYDVLIVPLKNINGEIRSFQRIYADGQKSFLKGGQISGCFFQIKEIKDIVIVCEGFATGASIHECTSLPVVVALNASNLKNVAVELRKKYGEGLKIVIAGDDDVLRVKEKNPGRKYAKIAAKACDGIVTFPEFTLDEIGNGLTDFNDLHQVRGKSAIKEHFSTL